MFQIQNYFQKRRHKRLVSLFNIGSASKVLDISCGRGDLLSILHMYTPTATFLGIDMSEEAIYYARKNYSWGSFLVARAESLPNGNSNFDTILCCMSFHHYENPHKVFSEIARILAPNGILYICDLIPKYRWLQIWHNWQKCSEPYHFEKYYMRKDIEALGAKVGLVVVADRLTNPISFSEIKMLSLRKI